MKDKVVLRIKERSSIVAVVGLGYVGLPLLLRFTEAGFTTIGIDRDDKKISSLMAGESYLKHIPSSVILSAVSRGAMSATTDIARVADADVIIICLPTPLTKHRSPDLSFVTSSLDAIAPYIHSGHTLVLESTTYPGTTEEEVVPRVEAAGFTVGEDVFVVYSPEREDPGNAQFSTKTIPKICAGVTPNCSEVGQVLYGQVVDRVIPVSNTRTAEMVKLLENVHRAVNIGLVNELKTVADAMGIDILEVIDAAATKPFGFVPYYPGPGLGGHCIPIDPYYLTWKAREYGVHTRFVELAGEVNSGMPDWVTSKVVNALNEVGLAVKGANVLILGLAYKKNIDDMRESPSLAIMTKLLEKGARVAYSDPYIPRLADLEGQPVDLESIDLTAKRVAQYDCVVIATNHDEFDYAAIQQHARLIVDTRGVYRRPSPKVVRA